MPLCRYYDEVLDDMITAPSAVTWAYVRGWLVFDLVTGFSSAVSLVALFTDVSSLGGVAQLKAMKIIRLLRVFKLLQLSKHNDMLGWIDKVMPGSAIVAQVLKILMGLVLLVHLVSCFFFLMTSLDENNWMQQYFGPDWEELGFEKHYLTAFYWGVVTVTTVGYGDITPANDGERMFAAMTCLLGSMLSAIFIGELADATTQQNASKAVRVLRSSHAIACHPSARRLLTLANY